MSGSRTVIISYGSWATNDTGFNLTGVHDISQDERKFTVSFDVVVVGSSAAQARTYAGTMVTALNQRHQTVVVSVGGSDFYHFVDGADGAPSSSQEGAEFIQANWELLGTHRTDKTRAYRVTIEVTRAAKQTGKLGVLDQSITVITSAVGKRGLSFRAQFTPGPSDSESGTAQDRHDDGTYGFDALVSALQTVLGGTWERNGIKGTAYDEDSRTLSAWASYTELLYDQSEAGTDDPALVNIRYDISVERKSAPAIPEDVTARPFTGIGVSFSSGIDKTWLASNSYTAAIEDKIIPYIKSTLAIEIQSQSVIYLGHGLKADPMNLRIAGQILFLAIESNTLELSKRVVDSAFTGDVFVPVLDGRRWTRDRHTGPGTWTRRVIIGTKVIGEDATQVTGAIEEREKKLQRASGFEFVNWGVSTFSVVEKFHETLGGDVTTTTQMLELIFTRANPRGTENSDADKRVPKGHVERGLSGGNFDG